MGTGSDLSPGNITKNRGAVEPMSVLEMACKERGGILLPQKQERASLKQQNRKDK